jgi:hypothetical protein
MSAFRVVMVSFVPGTTDTQVEQFHGWLQDLASQAPGLVRMVCGPTEELGNEALLARDAPDATYGSFASIWEFEDQAALAAFVNAPTHRAVARELFLSLVAHRYVFNLVDRAEYGKEIVDT